MKRYYLGKFTQFFKNKLATPSSTPRCSENVQHTCREAANLLLIEAFELFFQDRRRSDFLAGELFCLLRHAFLSSLECDSHLSMNDDQLFSKLTLISCTIVAFLFGKIWFQGGFESNKTDVSDYSEIQSQQIQFKAPSTKTAIIQESIEPAINDRVILSESKTPEPEPTTKFVNHSNFELASKLSKNLTKTLEKNCFIEYIKQLMNDETTPLNSQQKPIFDKETGPFYINNEHRYEKSAKITCNDDTCTEGTWQDCDCEYTSIMSMQYDTWRGMKSVLQMAVMLGSEQETVFCGHKSPKNETSWCSPIGDKSCCKSGVCSEKEDCEKMTGVVWNSIPPQNDGVPDEATEKTSLKADKPYRQDMGLYKEAEACLWKPKNSDFRVFNKNELIKKLQGKQLNIVPNSNLILTMAYIIIILIFSRMSHK